MKLKKLALLPLAAGAVFGMAALADSGKITFKGKVAGSTCIPKVNGQAEGTVRLPAVTASMFPARGDTAGETTFTIDLSECQDITGTMVKAYFWQPNASAEGRLVGTGSGAGWTYELLPAAGETALKVGTSGSALTVSNEDAGSDVSAGNGKLTYRVRYYNETGTLTNGEQDATVTYVLYTN